MAVSSPAQYIYTSPLVSGPRVTFETITVVTKLSKHRQHAKQARKSTKEKKKRMEAKGNEPQIPNDWLQHIRFCKPMQIGPTKVTTT